MSIERTAHPYIIRDSTIYGGEPIVEGTRTGVRHIILLFQSGQDPEEIASTQRLSLAHLVEILRQAQVHSPLPASSNQNSPFLYPISLIGTS